MTKIIYTHTDEAPALATHSFLPVIEVFVGAAGIDLELKDISLAGRILALFSDRLTPEQQTHNALAELGELVKTAEANIIKLPNVSASVPQLKDAIKELQEKGYDLLNYPDDPTTEAETEAKRLYDQAKGSAVNPVLREGNSDRRAPGAVKRYAKKNPHKMGQWSAESKSHVAHMDRGDFRSNEKSVVVEADDFLRIELVSDDGSVTVLKPETAVSAGEIVDSTVMSRSALIEFLTEQLADANKSGVLFSMHLKATMMKVSDPIIFGHAVKVFFARVFDKYQELLETVGSNPNDGLGSVLSAVARLDEADRKLVEAEIEAAYAAGPALAMVDSDRGITNLHVPSDTIVDASMPAMIRSSGQLWNGTGQLQDAKAVLPDSSYAGIYQAAINFCKKNGAFDPGTMGSVANVGLMAQKAEEYGSHDKTFEAAHAGTIRVVNQAGEALLDHQVAEGDIWRMCQTKDAPIQDWVKLAVNRARASETPAVFWLDPDRAHDANLLEKVKACLADHDTDGLQIEFMDPVSAINFSLVRIKDGLDTISVTGNVLRDYLTDLFPIIELGTSAKMLSIVPLMNGGGLFETGAGGSAPKHVQQFVAENHLRWDSLGEFLALGASLEYLSETSNNSKAKVLATTLDAATERLLNAHKSPSRKAKELDNRGSHFYLAMYWAQALARQNTDPELQSMFEPLARGLVDSEASIVSELNDIQGTSVELGGYFAPDPEVAAKAMRPSATFNSLIATVK